MRTPGVKGEMEAIRAEIADLYARRATGDIHDRAFERDLADRTLALYGAVARSRLVPGETIAREHHVVHAHMRVNQSVLHEPDQAAVSMFLTDRRLIRLRSTLSSGRPVTCDDRDGTVVDDVALASITGLRTRRESRLGEAVAGAAAAIVGIVFAEWLLFTSWMLVALGVLGILHGLLVPTRWIEVETSGRDHGTPFCIHGLRRKSGRDIVRVLRRAMR